MRRQGKILQEFHIWGLCSSVKPCRSFRKWDSLCIYINTHSNRAENLTCQELLCSFVRQKGENSLQHRVKIGYTETVMGHNWSKCVEMSDCTRVLGKSAITPDSQLSSTGRKISHRFWKLQQICAFMLHYLKSFTKQRELCPSTFKCRIFNTDRSYDHSQDFRSIIEPVVGSFCSK